MISPGVKRVVPVTVIATNFRSSGFLGALVACAGSWTGLISKKNAKASIGPNLTHIDFAGR